jgi:hypothetical protein
LAFWALGGKIEVRECDSGELVISSSNRALEDFGAYLERAGCTCMSLEWIGMMCYLKLRSPDLSLLALLGNFIQ